MIISDRGQVSIPVSTDIFSPFVTYKKNGNGLGLSLCKSLCEKCMIEISFKNNEFGGVNFELLIPAFEFETSSSLSSSISKPIEHGAPATMVGQ